MITLTCLSLGPASLRRLLSSGTQILSLGMMLLSLTFSMLRLHRLLLKFRLFPLESLTLSDGGQRRMVYEHQKRLSGFLTLKYTFSFLSRDPEVTAQAMSILTRAWKHRMLPPLLKTFCWRLI